MARIANCARVLRLVAAIAWLAASAAAAQEPVQAVPGIDDATLLRLTARREVKLPPRLFTPELVERLRQNKPTFLSTGYMHFFGRVDVGQRYVAQIPEARWCELISPYAAFSSRCGSNQNSSESGLCPFCGKTYGGALMSTEEFLQDPFRARTGCCGQIICEHEPDMPADYKARPNRTEKIPHLDGTTYDYRFYVPPGTENAGPEFGTARRHWFCSASEVWWARERFFHTESPDSVLTNLAAAAFQANDAKAVRALAVILDRLAEVFPGYPLVDNGGIPHGLARSADGKSYLTRDEYRAIQVPCRWQRPAWARIPPHYNLGKMNHGSGWQDGVMLNTGNLAAVFDLIRDLPDTRAYSREKYQSDSAWEAKVRKGVLDELHFMGQWSSPGDGGNTSLNWIMGAIKLSLVTQDPYFLQTAAEMIGPVIDNHYFSDGMSTEGASNYASMLRPLIILTGQLRDCLGFDLRATHPQLATIDGCSDAPVTTLYGIESMHSDEHAYFFTGNGTGWKFPPEKPDYGKHETAQCFPEYGLACLRAGAPGSRMESILDFQMATAHTHSARLNVQLFYEGVNVLPDIGYACGAVDVTQPPWAGIQYPFEKLPLPAGTDYWGGWYYGYTGIPEAHCVALIDGDYAVADPKGGPLAFRRFLGGNTFGEPGYDAQFIEVDALGLFVPRPEPVQTFARQLLAVTLANGRPLLLDFFRIRGGQRHDLFWHAPAAGPDDQLDTSLGPGEPVAGSLNDVLNRANDKRIMKASPGRGTALFQRLERWAMPDSTWRATFHVQPARFNPVTDGGRKFYEPWVQALHNVDLRLWSATLGSAAETREVLTGRMPWPSKIREVVDGKEISGVVSLKDAFRFLMASRSTTKPGLSTTFVSVLEPFNPEQAPAVEKVEAIASDRSDTSDSTAMAAGVRITLAAGPGAATADPATRVVLAATTADGGSFSGGGMTLAGRLGVLQPANQSLTLFDGTRFTAAGFDVTQEASWQLALVGVIGDLTGHPGESALVVESPRPLPTDRTLVGRVLTVQHRISAQHSSGYTIERVSAFGPKCFRLDLRDCPSFVVQRYQVRESNPQDARLITVNYWLLKGDGAGESCAYTGRRVRFPKSGFDTGMALGPARDAWHHNVIRLDQAPPTPVAVGDPLIVYQIQPGDTVAIPSHFACKGAQTPEGLELAVATTGRVTLTVPGPWRQAALRSGPTRTALAGTTTDTGALRIPLKAADVADGRATLLLTK